MSARWLGKTYRSAALGAKSTVRIAPRATLLHPYPAGALNPTPKSCPHTLTSLAS